MQDNNIEDDSSEVYVYLKRPFLFNIRYNSREIWNKMTEEDKVQYINYEEFYEEYRLKAKKYRVSDTCGGVSVCNVSNDTLYHIHVYRL